MAGKFARSWALLKASARILRTDKSLLAFPLLSGLCSLLVAASFLIPIGFAVTSGGHAEEFSSRQMTLGHYLALFAFYLVQYFVLVHAPKTLSAEEKGIYSSV